MPPYRFRLEPIRRLRQSERDDLRGQLADAYRAAEVLGQQSASVARELDELRVYQRDETGSKGVNVNHLLEAQRYELVLKGQQSALAQKAKLVEAEIERRRDAVALAERRVKTFDKLEEKQQAAQRLEAERAIAKQMDETAIAAPQRRDLTARSDQA